MITFLLIYFIGKAFYTLAREFQKNRWGYAILGVIVYYFGVFLSVVVIGLIMEMGMNQSVEDYSDFALGLIALPFGLLSCWGFYELLKRQWRKPSRLDNKQALDGEI